MFIRVLFILVGVLWAAVLLTIAYRVFWAESSRESTLPVHRPQQRRPPPPRRPSSSQSYRPSPRTPLLHPPEQHRPVYQPLPRPPPPSQSYGTLSYSHPLPRPEQHRPVHQPPPRPPSPSQSHGTLSYSHPLPRPEQHRPVLQPPPRPPSPSQSHGTLSYSHPLHRPEQHQPASQPPPHRPPPSQSYQSSPHRPPSPLGPPTHEDDNQQGQPDENYDDLRARANKEGDEMARCFDESHEAQMRGDRAAAKDLSNQGKIHKQKMEQLHKEASDCIYLENNRYRNPGEIDLHGLYVKEAIARTETALEEANLRGDSEIRLIVGKGLHSEGGTAKVRPAIKDLMRKYQLAAELDLSNSGVLIVKLDGLTPTRHR